MTSAQAVNLSWVHQAQNAGFLDGPSAASAKSGSIDGEDRGEVVNCGQFADLPCGLSFATM